MKQQPVLEKGKRDTGVAISREIAGNLFGADVQAKKSDKGVELFTRLKMKKLEADRIIRLDQQGKAVERAGYGYYCEFKDKSTIYVVIASDAMYIGGVSVRLGEVDSPAQKLDMIRRGLRAAESASKMKAPLLSRASAQLEALRTRSEPLPPPERIIRDPMDERGTVPTYYPPSTRKERAAARYEEIIRFGIANNVRKMLKIYGENDLYKHVANKENGTVTFSPFNP